MSKVLNDYTVIVNALYAKQTDYLNYDDIKEYKKLLYKMLSKEFKYILFETTLPDIFEIDDHMFIKLKDGITLETNVSHVENYAWPLKKALYTNKKLIEY